jgi:hypothetical protein
MCCSALFDLDAQPVATDYLKEAATQLSVRQSRRC